MGENEAPRIRPSDIQGRAIEFQPDFRLAVIGHDGCHQIPVGGRVIVLHEMAKFVQHNVIHHEMRCHDDAPVEIDPAVDMAASPASPVGLDANMAGCDPQVDGVSG